MNINFLIVNLLIWYITVVNAKPNKIVGGEIINIRQFPYVVSIQRNEYHICGGGIISENHIITSASCITHDISVIYGNLDVVSGVDDLILNTGSSQTRHVQLVIIHPQYNDKKFWINDIAILKLEKPILIYWNRRSALLYSTKRNHNFIMIAGWGGTAETFYEPSRFMTRIKVYELSRQLCLDYYEKFGGVYENQRCATSSDPTQQYVTTGDGGSSLIKARVIVGVVSLKSPKNEEPIICTAVEPYIEWIQQMMELY